MGQVHFEIFDFLVKVKSPLGQSIFSFPFSYLNFFFFFFFFQAVRTGQVSRSVRVNPGQTLVDGDVMNDVTTLDSYGTCAHVARVARALAPTVWRVYTREI